MEDWKDSPYSPGLAKRHFHSDNKCITKRGLYVRSSALHDSNRLYSLKVSGDFGKFDTAHSGCCVYTVFT